MESLKLLLPFTLFLLVSVLMAPAASATEAPLVGCDVATHVWGVQYECEVLGLTEEDTVAWCPEGWCVDRGIVRCYVSDGPFWCALI